MKCLRLLLVLAALNPISAHADEARAHQIGRALSYFAHMNGYGRIEANAVIEAPAYVDAHAITCDLIDGQRLALSFLATDEGEDLAAITHGARDSVDQGLVVATMAAGQAVDAFGVVIMPRACNLFLADGSPVVIGRK